MSTDESAPDGERSKPPGQEPPTVVGIGASAGGLAALKEFFAHVPVDSGLAFVIVVHLSPEHESHLAEVLQPYVSIPVLQVTETTPLRRNMVYVIPPNRNLSAIDTHLRLDQLEEQRLARAPIDHFFRTLAKTHDGHAVSVILTGTGSDGTLGTKQIKELGGLTIVQDPMEAEHDGMPQSAIATGLVDLVLPLAQIPAAIMRFAHTEPHVPLPENGAPGEDVARQLTHKIFAQLRAQTDRDFSRYKRSTIKRRIERRMQINQIEELEQYLDLMRRRPAEVLALADDLLITVTNFFRDEEMFETLQRAIIPQLFRGKGLDDDVRVWSVGCATGEEAYSLAILLLEEAGRHPTPPRVQVFASDLHTRSLERAREGFYSGDIRADVSEARLKRFFVEENGGYRIRKEVREIVLFAPHNLLADPPFSRLHLISCRNLMIYLERDVQRAAFELFHYALVPDGALVLGMSETVSDTTLFRSEHKKYCIYRKRNVPVPEPQLPVVPMTGRGFRRELAPQEAVRGPIAYGALHQRMVEQLAPPSVLVSADHKIVHISEHASRYLVHSGGEPTLNVMKLVRNELRSELQAALNTARDKRSPVRTRAHSITIDGEARQIALYVRPASEPHDEPFFLVIFEEWSSDPSSEHLAGESAEPSVHSRIQELEAERQLSQQQQQAIYEEYETSQEELRASNEELQSANEELRSTLEELETSKEELQSINEELQTVNQENRHRVDELAQLTGDLQNLLAATEIATLFLDRECRIQRFTPKVTELFNVRMTDRGRTLSDFTHRLGYDRMQEDAKLVLERQVPIEREVQDDAGQWYMTRVLPYRSSDDRIEGVVMTFVNITARKQDSEALRQSEAQFRALVAASAQIVWTAAADGSAVEDSPSWQAFTGQTFEQAKGWGWLDAFHPEDRENVESCWRRTIQGSSAGSAEFRLAHAPSGGYRWTSIRYVPLQSSDGAVTGWVGMNTDITDRKDFEQSLDKARLTAEEANRSRGEFLANMSHEIRTPMTAILGYADILYERLRDPDDQECLETIRSNGKFLIEVVNDILDLSKIDSGMLHVSQQRVAPSDLMSEIRSLMNVRAREKDLPLKIEIEAGVPACIETDLVRLRQILLNLVSNAIKFTDQGSVWVRVRYCPETRQLQFEVSDTGVGIRAEDIEGLFQPFTQADASSTRAFSGTGLGLTISRRLAHMLGGEISVESVPSEGSTFTLSITCDPCEVSQGRDHLGAAPQENLRIDGRVLVVDDHREIRFLAQHFIEKAGGRVVCAASGQEAIACAAQSLQAEEGFDAIVMDIHMPLLDGFQTADQIRGLGYSEPIIALTASAMSHDRDRCLEAGFTAYTTKPIHGPGLVGLIAKILASARRAKEQVET